MSHLNIILNYDLKVAAYSNFTGGLVTKHGVATHA